MGWINGTGGAWGSITAMGSQVALSWSEANSLASPVNTLSTGALLFGDFTKWCHSLIYYPMDMGGGTSGTLTAGGVSYPGVTCELLSSTAQIGAYDMGQYRVQGTYNLGTETWYRDYAPYTRLEVFLPYYGTVEVDPKDCMGKYLQFRLFVDNMSGQALWVVGVNDNAVSKGVGSACAGTDDTNTRVLGSYQFQFGTVVPLSSTGFVDTVRNGVIMAARIGALASGAAVAALAPRGGTTSTTEKVTNTARNPATGRQITMGTTTTETSTESASPGPGLGNSITGTIPMALSGFNATPHTTGSTITNLNNNLSLDIIVTRYTAQLAQTLSTLPSSPDAFTIAMGRPVGKYDSISNYSGYVQFSDVYLGSVGTGMTYTELKELEALLKSGVYNNYTSS